MFQVQKKDICKSSNMLDRLQVIKANNQIKLTLVTVLSKNSKTFTPQNKIK